MATNRQRAGMQRAPTTAQRQKLRRVSNATAAATTHAYAAPRATTRA